MTKLIILDRDGIINQDSLEYIKSPDEFVLIPGSVEAIAALTRAGYHVAVATNQSGISRRLYDEAQLTAIHEKMKACVRAAGGRIDLVLHCPHMPESGCACRKPNPGLLQAIAKHFNKTSLAGVPFVGDRVSDIQAAKAAGALPIMVLSSMTDKVALAEYADVPVFSSLAEYVSELLYPTRKDIHLGQHEGKLALFSPRFSPLWVDFNNETLARRRKSGKNQGLIRACKPARGVRILDVTAGWGRDAALLASFGAEVLMLERQPMMAALLADGLKRLGETSPLKLSLIEISANQYLENLAEEDYPDIIYMDPMHPLRQKSALVKKDMQVLHDLIGADEGVAELIQLAITRVKHRVVVKWPQRLAALWPADLSVAGKTVRFDCYLKSC